MRRSPSLLLLPLLLAAATACGGGDDADRDDSGQVTGSEEIAVEALRVGDCLQTPDEGVVTELTAIPCDQPHDGEVYSSFDLEQADAYPGDDAVDAAVDAQCLPAFAEFVGLPYDESELELSPLTPTEEGFEAGDREVLCLVQDLDGGVTGTLRGAAR